MKLIDRFVSRELLVNVAFAIAVLSLVLVVGNIFRKLLPLLVILPVLLTPPVVEVKTIEPPLPVPSPLLARFP